jgi:hypothetical protein
MSDAENDARFCPLCDVSLDLHDGPDTCHVASQKEFVIGLSYVQAIRTEGDRR